MRGKKIKTDKIQQELQGVSENTDTFVLPIVSMILPAVSWDKHLKIASSMEIC